jgi:hypothetical protein
MPIALLNIRFRGYSGHSDCERTTIRERGGAEKPTPVLKNKPIRVLVIACLGRSHPWQRRWNFIATACIEVNQMLLTAVAEDDDNQQNTVRRCSITCPSRHAPYLS